MPIDALNRDVRQVAGTAAPAGQHVGAQIAEGLTGAPVSAAQEALGVKLSATRHDHTVSLVNALSDVQRDSTRRLLDSF